MSERDIILKVEDIEVKYGDFLAIRDLSMEVEKGKITTIIGANGAGKSTLLDTVMGINKPTKGKIWFKDEDITKLKTNAIVRKGISMAPEGSLVFEGMTVRENLLMGSYVPESRKKRAELFERVFTLFPVLKEKENQAATYLSGGQRQMLAIGRALMADSDIVICDEISLGLAPVIINFIFDKVKEINREFGTTFIIVDQEVQRSIDNSDYSFVMVKGNMVMEGDPAHLDVDEVKDAFFGMNKYA